MGPETAQTKSRTQTPLINTARPRPSPNAYGVSASGEPKIDQLPALIDSPPQVAPTAIHPHVGLVHMPLQPAPGTMRTVGSFPDLLSKFLNPPVDRRRISRDPALGQKIPHITVRQWVSAVPANRQEDNISRKAVLFKRISARHVASSYISAEQCCAS